MLILSLHSTKATIHPAATSGRTNQATTVKGSGKWLSLHKYTQKKNKKKKKKTPPMYPLIGCKLVTSLPSSASGSGAVVEIVHPNSCIATVPSPVGSPP